MKTASWLFSVAVLSVVLHGAAAAQTLTVLVTNDDGIMAPGIDALVEQLALNPNLDIHVIAPATNQSGTTDGFTTTPFGVAAGTTASGVGGIAVSGKPADSVLYGVLEAMDPDPDLVISGINAGQNIGRFIAEDLSGTVGAALTAARMGIPAFAVSAGLGTTDYSASAVYTANLVEDFRAKKRLPKKMISKAGLDQRLVLNINFPFCSAGAVRGVELVPLAPSQDILSRVVTGYTMTGPGMFQATLSTTNAFTSNCESTLEDPTTDIEAMNNGFASLTALNPDVTVDGKLKRFKFLTKIPFD
jgi:5'-nucleotidase